MGIEQPTEGTVKLGDHNDPGCFGRIRLKPGLDKTVMKRSIMEVLEE